MSDDNVLSTAEKQIFKKRIMLRATLFALILVCSTMLIAMAILKLLNH